MEISEKGLKLIKDSEGFRSEPYLDSVNVATIGYGTTVYPDWKKVTLKDPQITEAMANDYLKNHLNIKVEKQLSDWCMRNSVTLSQNEFDALCSFIYNLGFGAFEGSTLAKKIKNKDSKNSIADEFGRWVKAGGKVLSGLVKRREAERKLFLGL
jgi:lysozyme